MLRILIIILALAGYGAYSLLGSISDSPVTPPQPIGGDASQPVSSGFSLTSAADMAINAAAATAGMQFAPLPPQGCSDSMLPPAKVEELVYSMPEPQRTALATVLNASSHVWTAQLYKGDNGVGLCLPVPGKLIVLPRGINTAIDQVGAVITPLRAN